MKDVYRKILNAIDTHKIDLDEDILVVKRRFFTNASDQAIAEFAQTWFVSEQQLRLSAVQFEIGSDSIPNIGGIIDSKRFDLYKAVHPDAKPLKYIPEIKRQWKTTLKEVIVPLNDELR